MREPLCVDLFCGVGGLTDAALAEGYFCIGVDIERHVYGEHRYRGQLIIQNALTLHGSQFRDAAFIWASPAWRRFFLGCVASSYKALKRTIPILKAMIAKEI